MLSMSAPSTVGSTSFTRAQPRQLAIGGVDDGRDEHRDERAALVLQENGSDADKRQRAPGSGVRVHDTGGDELKRSGWEVCEWVPSARDGDAAVYS